LNGLDRQPGEDYEVIMVLGRDGIALAASSPDYVAKTFSERGYFQTALSGTATIGAPVLSKVTGIPSIPIAAPILSHDTVVGVFVLGVQAKFLGNLREMSQSISAATEEQTVTAKQVSQAVENVSEVTQSAASAAERMSSATEQLAGMAQELQQMVGQFKVSAEPRAKAALKGVAKIAAA
jgi:hypothetical protein